MLYLYLSVYTLITSYIEIGKITINHNSQIITYVVLYIYVLFDALTGMEDDHLL